MDPGSLRNFKDFLGMYNRMTENCFNRCVNNLNSRMLTDFEIKCVESCANKFIKYNNKLMTNFVSAQTIIVNKRIADAEQQQKLLESKAENAEGTVMQQETAVTS